MKSRLLGAACGCVFSISVNAAVVRFDTTEIVFNASGSANAIAGSWSANSMTIPIGSEVSFFTLEVKELSVSGGFENPRTIIITSLNPDISWPVAIGEIRLGSEPPFTITTVDVGSTAVISPSTYLIGWDLLHHMVQGHASPLITQGPVIMGWPSGGFDVNASGVLSVEAYGEAVIPIPAAVWLFGSGLIGLIGVARRRKQL